MVAGAADARHVCSNRQADPPPEASAPLIADATVRGENRCDDDGPTGEWAVSSLAHGRGRPTVPDASVRARRIECDGGAGSAQLTAAHIHVHVVEELRPADPPFRRSGFP